MPRIVLIHWRALEAEPHLTYLRQQGHAVELYATYDSAAHRSWRECPPDAFLIDLSRLPSHGREIAVHLRTGRNTRVVPLLFMAGAPEKVQALRQTLPDASYCNWEDIDAALTNALNGSRQEPVRPLPMMQRYSNRTAAQKLGITEGSQVRLVNPPRDIERLLEPLPRDVGLSEQVECAAAVTLWFVHDAAMLFEQLPGNAPLADRSKFWILWRKQKARQPRTEVTEQTLRDAALPLGLVDYKVCSVNDTWSALCFSYKKKLSTATR